MADKRFSFRRKDEFTIVELLVVVSIIAILAALFLPALNGAREAGIKTSCMNNLRQMGLDIIAYTDIYGGFIPVYRINNYPWTATLYRDRKGLKWDPYYQYNYCPISKAFNPTTEQGRKIYNTYGIKKYIQNDGAFEEAIGAKNHWPYTLPPFNGTYMITKEIRTPSTYWLIGDSIYNKNNASMPGMASEWLVYEKNDTSRGVCLAHQGTSNLLMLDSHAESWGKTKLQTKLSLANLPVFNRDGNPL